MAYRRVSHALVERMLRIHEELQRGVPTNCTSLGKMLEVSRKTLVRDVTYMRDRLELPISFDPKANTYRYTQPVGAFPTVKVTEGEVFALMVARKALELYRGTPFHRQLATSFDKLAAGLKEKVSFSPSEDLHSVSFKNIGLGKADMHVFNSLNRAVMRELEVEFDYRKPAATEVERRRVQPYHLANRENLWYLVAFDLERKALRTFALPRITQADVTEKKFKRPDDFSPDKFFANALGVMGGEKNYRIVVRFSRSVADRVREREWHETQKFKDLPDGVLEVSMKLGALPEIERWVMTWGAHAEVIEPKELRERLKETALKLTAMYKK